MPWCVEPAAQRPAGGAGKRRWAGRALWEARPPLPRQAARCPAAGVQVSARQGRQACSAPPGYQASEARPACLWEEWCVPA